MFTPERILRLIIEMIFVMLGGIVVLLGVTGKVYVDRHKPSWLILSAALILWGLRVLFGPGKPWARWQNWTRGLSFTLLGVLMLIISRVPFPWVGPMLVTGGVLLALRGIIGSALVFRPR
jgi:hypothetical protein